MYISKISELKTFSGSNNRFKKWLNQFFLKFKFFFQKNVIPLILFTKKLWFFKNKGPPVTILSLMGGADLGGSQFVLKYVSSPYISEKLKFLQRILSEVTITDTPVRHHNVGYIYKAV